MELAIRSALCELTCTVCGSSYTASYEGDLWLSPRDLLDALEEQTGCECGMCAHCAQALDRTGRNY